MPGSILPCCVTLACRVLAEAGSPVCGYVVFGCVETFASVPASQNKLLGCAVHGMVHGQAPLRTYVNQAAACGR